MDLFNTHKNGLYKYLKNILQCEVTYLRVPTWVSSEIYDVRSVKYLSIIFRHL
jgi:hypothetical protein